MAKKPWETKVFENKQDSDEQTSRKDKHSGFLSTPLLTGLLSVFFLIVVGILIVVFYTSSGGSDEAKATSGFYRSSQSQSKSQKANSGTKKSKKKATTGATEDNSTTSSPDETANSSSSSKDETTSTSSSEAGKGQTIVVQAGEGASSIAARAGISIEQLEALNPQHMTLGYWYANPGDQVYIN